jgi:hypothetical protein
VDVVDFEVLRFWASAGAVAHDGDALVAVSV